MAMGETISYIGCWFKAYTPFQRALSQPSWLLHTHCCYDSIFSDQLHQDGEHGKAKGLHEHGLLLHFLHCEVTSLVRSSALWNTAVLGKVFCKSMDSSFGKSITCRNTNSITRIYIYSNNNKALSSPWRNWSGVVHLPLGLWVVILGNDAKWRTHSLSLLLTDQHSAAAEARSALMSRNRYCWTHSWPLPLPPWPFCSWVHWAMMGMALKSSGVSTSYLLDYWTLLLLKSVFYEHLHETQLSSYPLSNLREIFTQYFPKFPSDQFFQSYSLQLADHLANP